MPYCVGLSGGIAAGKSLLCRHLSSGDIEIVDADVIARDLVMPGQPALLEIEAQLGKQFITADGTLDRSALRAHVFSDSAAKFRLEAILHPRIQTELRQRCESAKAAVSIAAIPLLSPQLRASLYHWLDRVVIIEAPWHVQRQRILERDGCSAATAEAMLAAQLSSSQRLPMAQDVLINDGDTANLQRWATRLQGLYRQLANDL